MAWVLRGLALVLGGAAVAFTLVDFWRSGLAFMMLANYILLATELHVLRARVRVVEQVAEVRAALQQVEDLTRPVAR